MPATAIKIHDNRVGSASVIHSNWHLSRGSLRNPFWNRVADSEASYLPAIPRRIDIDREYIHIV